ncbi:MAG: arsenite methyltransferase [Thermoproteota archaeon]
MKDKDLKKYVKDKYSKIARTQKSCCCSSSCCGTDPQPQAEQIGYSRKDLAKIPPEAIKGLGCGAPVNFLNLREGEKVLDLGSGLGVDVFLASEKVGSTGLAAGVDVSQDMVQKATEIAEKRGYENVEFRQGEIEKLPFEDEYFDAVISNCVINLSTDKLQTYKEIYRVLKPTGRILISDIVTEEELPEQIKKDPEAWSACLGGALTKERYLDIIKEAGFKEIEVLSQSNFASYPQLDTNVWSLQLKAFK